MSVDTSAPGYTLGHATIRRRILDKLFDRIDQPRPPEDGAIVQIEQPEAVIEAFSALLLEPETAALVSASMRTKGGIVVAEGLQSLGALAQSLGRNDQASRLYRKSADIRRTLRDETGALGALERVAGIYKSAGANTELRIVLKEISAIRKHTTPLG